jgi:hypothetical protein
MADEGGVSFWLPGQFGSISAAPTEPGWTLPMAIYYSRGDADADQLAPRSGSITVGVDTSSTLMFVAPTYAFSAPVLGGQLALSLGGGFGNSDVRVSATLAGPGGGVLSGADKDTMTGVSDLYPMVSLKWDHGHHNWMGYAMFGVPVGKYDVNSLANVGTHHWSADLGVGYTFLQTDRREEFSGTLGFTYNFENPDTNYRNGVDAHFDWSASRLIAPGYLVGLTGYFYQQVSGDSGEGATLGAFKSEVIGFGPQIGWFFDVDESPWYLNLRGYYEWNAKNRPEGWNVWLALEWPSRRLGSGS